MLNTIEAPRVAAAAPVRSKVAYLYLLRVPLSVGAVFVLLPYVAVKTGASSMLLGLFDMSDSGAWAIWAVSASAFMLALTLMMTVFLVLAYADDRCGASSFAVDYPIPLSWYAAASLAAIPTLAATYAVGHGSTATFVGACLLGLGTSSAIFWLGRRLVKQLDRIPGVLAFARWLAEHPELGSGYVDPATRRFLPGHRLAAILMALSMVLYGFIGRQMGRTGGFPVPTLAYALLLLIIAGWTLGALTFFLDRYRVPVALLIVLLVAATGFRGGSDHYFQLKASWASEAISPGAALAARMPNVPPRRSAIVVAANGGGIQAAAWTARVLTGLAEVCRAELGEQCTYAQSVRLISSVSGGSVGAMYFADAYKDGRLAADRLGQALERATRSSLAYVGWGLLYRDLFRPLYVIPRFDYQDRGSVLETAWQRGVYLDDPLEAWRDDVRGGSRPATIFNATISDSGERLLMGTANPPEALGRRNFENVFEWGDVGIVTAARLSAAFPYVSPAPRADNAEEQSIHFVDGGYYDTYGVASLIDWLDAALYENQLGPAESRIDRILILQLRGAPPSLEKKGKRRGWFYQVYAPLSALLGARDAGQLSHADEEVALFQRAWYGKVAISSAVFQFCGGPPPLSWHMTPAQKAAIESEWKFEEKYETTSAVMNFLRADQVPDRPSGPSGYIQGRCRPTPAEAERDTQQSQSPVGSRQS
jgi:hypothetical protein